MSNKLKLVKLDKNQLQQANIELNWLENKLAEILVSHPNRLKYHKDIRRQISEKKELLEYNILEND
jgi:CHASE3 domain sensor protein